MGADIRVVLAVGRLAVLSFLHTRQPISLSEGVKRKWAASVDKEKFSVLFFWENFDNQISADPFATFSLVSQWAERHGCWVSSSQWPHFSSGKKGKCFVNRARCVMSRQLFADKRSKAELAMELRDVSYTQCRAPKKKKKMSCKQKKSHRIR